MLSFNTDLIKFHYIVDTTDLRLKEGFGGWKEAQRQGDLTDIFIICIWFYKSDNFDHQLL
jgi:hypothetical protein